jgi:hypothetical protein
MQQRRGTAAQWTAANPILAAGEIGFETDTSKFKMGNGSSTWSALQYFANAAELAAIVDGAPGLLNTLDELAQAIGDDPAFFTTTTNNLATKAPINNPTFTGTVGGVTKSMVGLGNVDNTSDAAKPVSTAAQSALDLKAPLASAALTGTPTAPTASATTNTTQIATTEFVQTKINNLIGGAPELLDSLNELAAALDNDENFASSIGTALGTKASVTQLSDHNTSTENVHGIADTSVLVTDSILSDALTDNISTHNGLTTNVHGIADTTELATKTYSDDAVSDHNTATTNIHGIADTSLLVTQSDLENAIDGASVDQSSLAGTGIDWNTVDNRFDIDSTIATKAYADQAETDAIATAGTAADSKVSTAIAALTKSSVGLANVDNTSDTSKPVSTATQTALDLKANLNGPTFTGTVSGITKSMVGLGSVDNTADSAKPVSTATQTALDAKLALAGGTMTGALILSGAPTSDLHAATKIYVDNVTAGINFHESVHAASVSNLSTIYNNGTSGVGATLTADTNRAFSTLDGESVVVGQRVLIKNQTDSKQNGIYTLTTVGSGSAPWVLTRATDADNNPVGEMKTGDFVFVINGTANASVGYINNSTANPIVIGTDNISYTEFSAGKTVVAGSGLTEETPGTLSIATGAITSAMIADGAIVDADVNASAAIAQSKISGLTSDLAAKAPIANPTFTGTVTVAASGVAFTDGTQTKEGTPSRTPIIQKTAAYTLSALTERDSLIEVSHTGGSAVQITIPTDATLNFPIGTSIDILQTNTGGVTIAAATPGTTAVNSTPGSTLRTQWSSATLFKRAANTWVVYGDLK